MLVDCKEALAREGLAALQCGAFHIQTAGRRYFNTTPLGRAVTGTKLVQGDGRARRRHLGRRLDLQGKRHRALLPLRAARQREPAHLQAVARRSVRGRARRAQGDERVAARAGLPHGSSVEKAYSTDANMLGATHEAKDLELLADVDEDRRADHGRRALGPGRRDRAGDGDDHVRTRRAGGDRRHADRRPGRARSHGERDRRPPRARHVRPDREPHHRGEEPRHLRGARHGALADRLRAAPERDPQRGDARALRRGGPPARPPALRGSLVRRSGSDAARRAAALGRGRGDRRSGRSSFGAATTTRSSTRVATRSATAPSA